MKADKIRLIEKFSIEEKQFRISIVVIVGIAAVTISAIFWHNHTAFKERTQEVSAEKITENKYKIQFPFLAGSKAFENSIAKFKIDHPTERITYLYTAPAQLRLGESDGLIIYIQTEAR